MALRKFKSSEILLSNQEAWQILCYFFGGNAGASPSWLTENDRSFAQALLIEAVDQSYNMSWIHALFEATADPTTDVKSVLKALAKKALKDWLTHCNPTDLANAKIYRVIKNTLTMKWKSAWQIRLETGDPVY